MVSSVVWLAFALGGACWLAGLVLPRTRRREGGDTCASINPLHLAVGLVLACAVWLLTLPEAPPHAAGHGFGNGYVLGTLAGLLGILGLVAGLRADETTSDTRARVASQWGVAAMMAALPLVTMRSNLVDGVMGAAMGWLATTMLAMAGARPVECEEGGPAAAEALRRALGAGALFGALAASAALVAEHRGASSLECSRWGSALACAVTSVPLALLVSALVARIGALVRIAEVAAALVVLGVTLLVGARLVVDRSIVASCAAGLLAAWLATWAMRTGKGPQGTLMAGLAILAAAMTSFTWLAGVGTAIATVAAFLVAGSRAASDLAEPASGPSISLAPFGFGAAYLVYRLIEVTAGSRAGSLAVTDHHAAFAVMVGLAVPGLVGPFLATGMGRFGGMIRLAVVGVACVLAPLAFVLLWGEKTAFSLMLGLCLAPLAAGGWSGPEAASIAAAWSSAAAMGVGLLMAQWLGRVLEWTDMARAERGRIVLYVAVAAAVLLVVAEVQSRVVARLANRAGRRDPAA